MAMADSDQIVLVVGATLVAGNQMVDVEYLLAVSSEEPTDSATMTVALEDAKAQIRPGESLGYSHRCSRPEWYENTRTDLVPTH